MRGNDVKAQDKPVSSGGNAHTVRVLGLGFEFLPVKELQQSQSSAKTPFLNVVTLIFQIKISSLGKTFLCFGNSCKPDDGFHQPPQQQQPLWCQNC